MILIVNLFLSCHYTVLNDTQSVCLTSNSSQYSLNSSSAAVIRMHTPADDLSGEYCSFTSDALDRSFVCSSNNSSAFPNELVLFISLEELAKRERETINFIVLLSGSPLIQFSLNHGSLLFCKFDSIFNNYLLQCVK